MSFIAGTELVPDRVICLPTSKAGAKPAEQVMTLVINPAAEVVLLAIEATPPIVAVYPFADQPKNQVLSVL